MSNDLISGVLAGILFSGIIGLTIYAISKMDLKRIKFKRGNEYFLEILINLVINTAIILSVSDRLEIFKFFSYICLIAIVIL
ncbi:MAG TPA: hypothetical protein DDY89_15410, partial [Lysinibacillus sp.]|nr:hypothetical protein [Lysinibacillus sp.]